MDEKSVDIETNNTKSLSAQDSSNVSKERISEFKNEFVGSEKDSKDNIKKMNINKRPEKLKNEIPINFYYETDEVACLPRITDQSGLPLNVIQFSHSFGYNCHKRDNLVLLDESTLCYISGNYIELLNIDDMSRRYMRSLCGGGLGCLTVDRTRTYFAIGEQSYVQSPLVAIYEYPSLRLYRILKDGTERGFASCKFNTDGELLATVGSNPDYMLTVWEWRNEQVILRCKAFSQDVHRVLWSNELEGVLATGGSGHIRFWKMADSFTGLKLQGYLGKFGKTQISDIEGFVIFPDGKVLSGSEFGDLLVWDGELIKVQIGRKNKKPCHKGHINQIIMEEGEIITVGVDGTINTWDLDSIDSADVLQEMEIFGLQPMNELLVSADAQLMYIVKNPDKESAIWYAQDANGRIWKLDLSFTNTSVPPEILATFHSGEIRDCDTSPLSYLSASIGADGHIKVYDFAAKKMMAEIKFSGEGSRILWAPIQVDPKGKTLIAGFEDGVIRILNFVENIDTDILKKTTNPANITLIQALKPHTKKVTALCIDNKGEILVTGSDDETVFFFLIASPSYFPIGFVKLDRSIVHIEWIEGVIENDIETGSSIMVFMNEGAVAEVVCPDFKDVDQTQTYELREIWPSNIFEFMSIKSQLRHEEELKRLKKEEEERQEILAKERKIKLDNGTETEEEQRRQIEEEEKRRQEELEDEVEWVPFIPAEPSPINFGFADKADKNKFWLLMGGFDAGYLYKCQFPEMKKRKFIDKPYERNEPLLSPALRDSDDIPVTRLKWSISGKRALMSFENGSIRLQNVDTPFDLATMSSSWQFAMHDGKYGTITSLCLSYDEKFLITVGKDGNYFVYELMNEDLQQIEIEAYLTRVPSATINVSLDDVEDITDPHAYSIEEHKQKAELNRNLQLAAIKKAASLKHLQELQKKFKQLLDENYKLPERTRLDPSIFDLVPQLRADLIQMKNEHIALTRKQMAFESEKCRLALDKMEKRFREPLECDYMELHAIESRHMVTTIRGCHLPELYFKVLDDIERIKKEKINSNFSRDTNLTDLVPSPMDDDDGPTNIEDGLNKCGIKGARGMRIVRQLRKLESNRMKRKFRKAQWQALYVAKPAKNYEDPFDVEAIREATNKMGDFKLKSSKDHFVDECERPNALKSRSEILSIAYLTLQLRTNFNKKVLALREMKLEIMNLIKQTNLQVDKCNLISGDRKRKHIADIIYCAKEFPEKKFQFTKAALLDFKKELEIRNRKAIIDDDVSKQTFVSLNKSSPESAMRTTKFTRPQYATKPTMIDESTTIQDPPVTAKPNISLRQKEQKNLLNFITIHRTDFMINNARKKIRIFDMKLKMLRHEKFKLDVSLRRALLRQLIVFEEYRLLKMYEKSEQGLIQKADEKTEEKLDISTKLTDIQAKLDTSKKEIDRLLERDRLTFDKFKEALGDNNKFSEYLHKVYKKKIKRKKKDLSDTRDSDSSNSEDSDLSESEEEDDEDAIIYDLDRCPPGCSQEIYDTTCQLREIRLDIEEFLIEERKNNDVLKKDQEAFGKKAKIVKLALAEAQKELEAFQFEKQQKLNQLNTIVILKLHQILHHDKDRMPTDLFESLVIESASYNGLKARIQQLLGEEVQHAFTGKQLKLQHLRLQKNKRLLAEKLAETQVECNNTMTTKFGKVDNLEKMERIMINPRIEELTYKMMELQNKIYNEQSIWEDRIRNVQEWCINEITINSCALDNIHLLFSQKTVIEKQLNSKQKDLGGEFKNSDPDKIKEIDRLRQLVLVQLQELYDLKTEVSLLQKKGGHILPPLPSMCP